MNEKEIIEEMAKDILRHNKKINSYCALHTCEECLHTFPFPDCEAHNFATDAVILGYRKIPEGSVVLTKEEYEGKEIVVEMSGGHKLRLTVGKFGQMSRVLEKATRKETAKEFALKVKECKEIKELVELGYIVSYVDLCKEIDEIAKQYGVEL